MFIKSVIDMCTKLYPQIKCIYLYKRSFKFLLTFIILLLLFDVNVYGQGKLVSRPLGSTDAFWGYYEYLPGNYSPNSSTGFPLLVTFPGIGEKGNGTTELNKILKHGPAKLINQGKWPKERPFIVIAPQSWNGWFNPTGIHNFLSYLKKTYNVDTNRIYLTGLSAGAQSIWQYLEVHNDEVAGVIPISGTGYQPAKNKGCTFAHVPIWAFHGAADNTIGAYGSYESVKFINECTPTPDPKAKVTIYPGVGHDAWTRTYDLSGMNTSTDPKYDPYNENIYDWLLSHSKGSGKVEVPINQSPTVDAGSDLTVPLSQGEIKLKAECFDADGSIVSYQWEKVSGPDGSMQGSNSNELTVSNIEAGMYEFSVTVQDDDGAVGEDVVTVRVEESQATVPSDCGCDHIISGKHDVINIINASDYNYSAGDVFCIQAGTYKSFRFIGFKGSFTNPLVFKNCGGLVKIEGPTYSGIAFYKSQYVRITGSGHSSEPYGIKILYTKEGTSGVGVGDLSSDFEIDHLEISNTGFAGIIAKTDPNCNDPATWRENFTMRNLKIHNNYIHNTGGEGMYIGGTFGYASSSRKCNGIERFAHFLENVEIYDNLLEDTGWDGIQVNLVHSGAKIYNNTIIGYGTAKVYAQNQGMSIGGTKGKVYNNKIIQKPAYTTSNQMGISIIDLLTDTYFFNNVIVGSGKYGIWMHIRMTDEHLDLSKAYHFVNNTIIKPGGSGTFFMTGVPGGEGVRDYIKSIFYNNLIVDPGYNYENSGFWKTADEAFIDFNSPQERDKAVKSNNLFSRNMTTIKFVDPSNHNYNIKEGSPVIDKGKDVAGMGISFDMNGNKRPLGNAFDIGAYEYTSGGGASNQPPSVSAGQGQTVQLPVNTIKCTAHAIDKDGSIVSYLWKKVSGPSATLEGTNKNSLTVSNLQVGSYEFSVTVKDNEGATDEDKLKVIVSEAGTVSISDAITHLDFENNLMDASSLKVITEVEGIISFDENDKRVGSHSIKFDGSSILNLDEGNQFIHKEFEQRSIAFWFKSLDDSGIQDIYEEGGSTNGIAIRLVNNEIQLAVQNKHQIYSIKAGITRKKWHHVVGIFDKGSLRMYVDGVLSAEQNNMSFNSVSQHDNPAGLGGSNHSSPFDKTSKNFKGFVDDFYLFGKSIDVILPEIINYSNPQGPTDGDFMAGLKYQYYEGSWDKLPDFTKINSVKEGVVTNFSLTPRRRNDNYAFEYIGFIDIDKAGDYTFYTTSDDGSKLFIGNSLVVDNDGLHASREKSGQVYLKEGMHPIKVIFFEKTGHHKLEVKYESVGSGKQMIPASILYHEEVVVSKSEQPELPSQQSRFYKINITRKGYDSNNPEWYDIPLDNISGSKTFSNIIDARGKTSIVSVTVFDGMQGSTILGVKDNANGLTNGVYPDAILKHAAYTSGKGIFSIGNLDSGKKYSIHVYGGRATSGEIVTSYIVNGITKKLQCVNNTSKTLVFENISPNSNNEINVEFRQGGDTWAYINAIVIEEINLEGSRVENSEGSSNKFSVGNAEESIDEYLAERSSINVYPNPFQNSLYLKIDYKDFNLAHISVMDLLGQNIYESVFNNSGSSELKIDLSNNNLKKGVYVVRIKVDNNKTETFKVYAQ